jgi:hypothetical protein
MGAHWGFRKARTTLAQVRVVGQRVGANVTAATSIPSKPKIFAEAINAKFLRTPNYANCWKLARPAASWYQQCALAGSPSENDEKQAALSPWPASFFARANGTPVPSSIPPSLNLGGIDDARIHTITVSTRAFA